MATYISASATNGMKPLTCRCETLRDVTEALRSVIVLSHWPHVATQVEQQVAAHVASVKALLRNRY